MGKKKGRMSSGVDRSLGQGKWAIEDHRNIDRALSIARSTSYYVGERQFPSRKTLTEPSFLRCLLRSRLHDDELERRKILTSFPSKSADQTNRMNEMKHLKDSHSDEHAIRLCKNAECCTASNIRSDDVVPKLSTLCLDVIAANLCRYHPEDITYLTDNLLSDKRSTYLAIKSTKYGTLNDDNISVAANSDCQLIVLGEFVTTAGIKLLFENCGELYYNNDEIAAKDNWEEFDPENFQFRQLYSYLEEMYLIGTQVDAESLKLIGKKAPNIMKLHLHNIKDHVNSADMNLGSSSSSILFSLLEGFQCLAFLELSYCEGISIQNLILWKNAILYERNRHGCIFSALKCIQIIGWKKYQLQALKITSENQEQGRLACQRHDVECSNLIQDFQDSCGVTLIIE